MVKNIYIAIAAVGLSASAFAGYPAEVSLPAAPPTVSVTIPQQTGSWSIGVEALYQAQGNGDFNYALSRTNQSTTTGLDTLAEDNQKIHAVDPDSSWGWAVDLTYHFEGNGRDVELAWHHLHDSETDSITRPTGTTELWGVPTGQIGTASITGVTQPNQANFQTNNWDTAHGRSRNDYDHVDLVFGQKMDFGQKVTLRAFGGLRYADIDNHDRSYYTATVANVTDPNVNDVAVGELDLKSDFQGIGPRAGVDAKVRLGGNFSIVGTVAGSMLVGDLDHSLDAQGSITNGDTQAVTTNRLRVRASDNTRVVPEMDMRIGIEYVHAFNPDTALGVQVGYETINYFDAKDNSLGSFVDTMGHENDFAIYGPYVRLQLDLA